ncbi:MAG: O-antigen ligase family protein, partial [Chloroflexota bacterium]
LCAGLAVAGGLVLAFGGPVVALALLVGVAAVFVVLRNIEVGFWGVIGVICLLPFATIPIDIGVTPTFLDLALGAVIGTWALRLATGQQRTIITTPITIPLVAFLLVAVFAFIFGLSNGPLTSTLIRHFAELLLSIGFVLVIVDYCSDWSRLEGLVKVLILAGTAAAAIAIFLWLLPDETTNALLNTLARLGYPGGFVIRYIEDNPELSERAIGTSVDPNALGGLLVMIGALAGPQLVSRRPLLPRWLAAGSPLVLFVAIILTFSRAAMAGLLTGLALVAVARYRRLLPYLALLALLVLLLPVTQGYVGRFLEGIQGQDLATQMRFGEYKDAFILIQRYPLFGVGFAGSPDIDVYLGVASVYLTILQEMGILGLVAFLTLLATLFGYAYFNRRPLRTDHRHAPVWLGLHAALVSALTVGIFDHYLFNLDFHHAVTIFWFFVGLAAAATRLAGLDRQD